MKFPENAPDECLTIENFVDSPDDSSPQLLPSSIGSERKNFWPYPNHSSFLLGEWYWNNGFLKSQRDFSDLIEIVGHPDFKPDDVRETKFADINSTLGSNANENTSWANDTEFEWLDEGWRCSEITIQVPFHRRTGNPGVRPYVVGEFYHRSLVAVIRERLESVDANTQFHFEPYELLWRRGDRLKDVRVYGEMYMSEKFLAMHRSILNAPPVPGCKAPKAIIPLMFWSDATHLTSFGQAKLWPLYLFFGNDSKYLRCKPSTNLCNHMAYFQKVRSHLCGTNILVQYTDLYLAVAGCFQ